MKGERWDGAATEPAGSHAKNPCRRLFVRAGAIYKLLIVQFPESGSGRLTVNVGDNMGPELVASLIPHVPFGFANVADCKLFFGVFFGYFEGLFLAALGTFYSDDFSLFISHV
jgi:hypothetical protein